jgi:hypothetical protein
MANGISLHFGINDYSFRGQSNLGGCINDAISMKKIADSFKYDSYIFKDSKATYKNLVYSLINASTKLFDGDILFITFAGHGSQIKDNGKDEPDNEDSYILLYDDDFYDDELMVLLKLFREGVRVFCIFDSCQSSTMIDTDVSARDGKEIDRLISKLGESFRKSIQKINKFELKCSAKSLSGVWDSRYASDGAGLNGLFTEYLLKVWDEGKYKKNIRTYFYDVRLKLVNEKGSYYMPTYQKRGPGISKFNSMRPYEI